MSLTTNTNSPDSPSPNRPVVNLTDSPYTVARTVGKILQSAPLYLFHEEYCTVSPRGEVTLMTPARFVSWIESHIAFSRGKSAHSISILMARQILEADVFRVQIRKINAVSEVRLPVWRGDGEARTIELAPEGYDTSTGIFTVNSIPYPDDIPLDQAWDFLWDTLKEFPFDLEGAGSIQECRSLSAQLSAMLGVFCYSLFPEGTLRPMVVYNANQHGSGKSLLMRLALAPVHGSPAVSGKPETENEFEKVLDSAALARKPYLVLDDCKSIHSQTLNRFLTGPLHECRLMHSQQIVRIPKVTQVWAAGNDLTIFEDLDRRALVVDLFESKEAASRKFAKEITQSWLFMPETRARFLSCLWALVRTWRDQGMPPLPDHHRASFEDWTNLIGGIVMTGSFHNPFTPRPAPKVRDESQELEQLLGFLVGQAETSMPPMISTDEILANMPADGVLTTIPGFAKEPKKALGLHLKKLRGRKLVDAQGRAYMISRSPNSIGHLLIISFVAGESPES